MKKKIGLRTSCIVLASVLVTVIACKLIERIPFTIDTTESKLYEISDQTKSIVKSIDQDVEIYVLNSKDEFLLNYKQTVEAYEKMNSHVKVYYRDLIEYPGFLADYKPGIEGTTNSILVVSGERSLYLNEKDYFRESYDEENGNSTYSYELEGLLTNAIETVTGNGEDKIYQTVGHQELEISADFAERIERENYSLEELALTDISEIPEDAGLVFINSPMDDFTEKECNMLREYVKNGGKLCYMAEPSIELPNLIALMKDYGITVVEGIVAEQNTNMIYSDTDGSAVPTYILPTIESTEITDVFIDNRLPIFLPVTKGFTIKEKKGYESLALLSTSSYAFSKVDLESEYSSREDDDIVGPFTLAAVVKSTENDGAVCVFGCPNMLTEEVDSMVYNNNSDLLLDTWDYMQGDLEKIAIRGKQINYDVRMYTNQFIRIWGMILIIIIPMLILACGIMVVVSRTKKSQKPAKEADA